MSAATLPTFVAVFAMGITSVAFAAGGGGGAGGSGHQRAINSGLPQGEQGPPGSTNNKTSAPAQAPSNAQVSPQAESGDQKAQ